MQSILQLKRVRAQIRGFMPFSFQNHRKIKKPEISKRGFPIFYTLGNCAEAALRLCYYASGSIAEMPRCSTGVEKTICVRVRPKRCSWLINWSSSCVVWKQTSTSME